MRTITPEEYSASSWIGRTAEDVALAWGENGNGEPDGAGGSVLSYRRLKTTPAPQPTPDPLGGAAASLPNRVVELDVIAKFWIGTEGKVYRYWFVDEVYKKRLDAPGTRPVDTYGRTTP